MGQPSEMTRREVLRTAAGGVAAVALSGGPSRALAEESGGARIRVGFIGIGRRCREHMSCAKSLPEKCRVTAMCDILPERAEKGAQAFGGKPRVFTKHTDLIHAGVCDAVVVATPNYTHKQIAVDALHGGLHVLCEKPMATTLDDARAMVEAVGESGRTFAVGLQFRYVPLYRKLREVLDEGVIGELKYIWAQEFRGDWARLYDDPEENARKNWRYYYKLSGGTLVEKNCHDFDILGWYAGGAPQVVTATGGNAVYRDRETIDHASVSAEYKSGVNVTLGMCLFAKFHQADTAFVGTEGTITFPRGGAYLVVHRPKKKQERIETPDPDQQQRGHRGTRALHVDFYESIAKSRQPVASVQVGYESLRVPIAAQHAIRENRVVTLR
jgi:predicted dehydrogenase